MIVQFELNGSLLKVEVEPGTTLLEFLRTRQIHSVKHGCDHGECGACAVLLENKSMNACLILMHSIDEKKIETLENFSTHEHLHPLQESFLQAGAAQCGYCTPGMLLSLEALDREVHTVDEAEVRDALNGNLCRCTGYTKPVEAALKVLQANKNEKELS